MKCQKRVIAYGILWIVVLILNLLFWNSSAFSDFFVTFIFPLFVATYGRLTGLASFSVGEWLIVVGLITVLLFLVAAVLLLVCILRGMQTKGKRIAEGYMHFFGWEVACVALIMTCNCYSLYHTSSLEESFPLAGAEAVSEENMVLLWNHLATRCNELSKTFQRDADGYVVGYDVTGETEEKAIAYMKQLGSRFDRLNGYYPNPKRMFFSDFMCQQYMAGYYFPFSLEANINDVMCELKKPSSMCHELAHLKGYIQEDEASFLSFIACVESEDVFFQYSGYLSVLGYCAKDINDIAKEDATFADRYTFVQLNDQVILDTTFVTDEEWERINSQAIFNTKTVEKASDTFVNTSLMLNGVGEGKHIYGKVVQLVLRYFAYHNSF